MRIKRGSALLSMVMTIGGVGAIAAAGFVFTGGSCGASGDCATKTTNSTIVQSGFARCQEDRSRCASRQHRRQERLLKG